MLSRCSFAWSKVKPDIFSRISIWLFLMDSASASFSSAFLFLFWSCSSRRSILSFFLSRFSSFCWSLLSERVTSALRSLSSLSVSLLSFWISFSLFSLSLKISSLASTSAVFFVAWAFSLASDTILLASFSADSICASAVFFLCSIPILNKTEYRRSDYECRRTECNCKPHFHGLAFLLFWIAVSRRRKTA